MERLNTNSRNKGHLFVLLLYFAIWVCRFRIGRAKSMWPEANRVYSSSLQVSQQRNETFGPIEISPSVIPNLSIPSASLPPMYPIYPDTYNPVLTGRCPVNFSSISSLLEKTASDCDHPLAAVASDVICCPQFISLLRIFQGTYGMSSDKLVLPNDFADDCFQDIVSILSSKGASSLISTICNAKSSNLTGGSCPVKDMETVEKVVNTTELLGACGNIDPLKECCRPMCQPAIMTALLRISGMQTFGNDDIVSVSSPADMLNDCKGVVYSYISRKLSHDSANTVFRILSACKVNKACPLDLKEPSDVISACRNVAAPSLSCCSSLNSYMERVQKQMLVTNRQAIICSITLGSMLRKGGVMTNIYELCDVDLEDFSLQVYGQQGCLLGSLPTDMVYDNSTGFSFTCDLRDNIAAPWPSSASMTTISLCASETSLPEIPRSQKSGSPGSYGGGIHVLWQRSILSIFVLCTLLFVLK